VTSTERGQTGQGACTAYPAQPVPRGAGAPLAFAKTHRLDRVSANIESARIQTFPDDFIFDGTWSESMRQPGNAVPVRLAAVMAEQVIASRP
jgi:site-specific DNA-cytosine methylase